MAINEAQHLKGQLNNIDIVSFEQTQDLENLDYIIDELSITEAAALNEKLKNDPLSLNVKFVKNDDGLKITAMYSANDKERAQALKGRKAYLS